MSGNSTAAGRGPIGKIPSYDSLVAQGDGEEVSQRLDRLAAQIGKGVGKLQDDEESKDQGTVADLSAQFSCIKR